MALSIDAIAPHVAIITETNVPHADNITYFGNGTDEAQMVYNFALPPLVLHTFQTGNTTKLTNWASNLSTPSDTTCFLNILDSHDGIGIEGSRGILDEDEIKLMVERVKEHGGLISMKDTSDGSEIPYEMNITWYSALNLEDSDDSQALKIKRFIASRSISLILKGVPGIYLPSMFGSKNDFESIYKGAPKRSINRKAIHEDQLFKAFGESNSVPARIAASYIDLLEIRVAHPAFHPCSRQEIMHLNKCVFCVKRIPKDRSSSVLCIVNVTDEEVELNFSPKTGEEDKTSFVNLIGGQTYKTENGMLQCSLKPYQIIWLEES